MSNKDSKPVLMRVNGELTDLGAASVEADQFEFVFPEHPDALNVFRHSCAHLLAHAVVELFPGVQYGVGPAVENGFYYDFLTESPFTPEDLEKIARRMAHLAKQNLSIKREILSKQDALELFSRQGQFLKVELIHEKVEGDSVTVYRQGDFSDLCRGPHLPSTGLLKHFKLLSVAAAYWKGDEASHSMQRIYGVVFPTRQQLDDHLSFLKQARERDHRKLGRDLDLFSIQNEIGAGLVLWHPRGGTIRYEVEKYWREEHLRSGYELLYTPHIARGELWETSGHKGFYSENMFTPIEFDHTEYQLKPMNCPFHLVVFKSRTRSWRELPLRWAELGTVYRYERSGVLHGLLRVRGFTQDDAHIFCTRDQILEEVKELIRFSLNILKTFGFTDLDVFLSTRPENFVGDPEEWDLATNALERALKESGVAFTVDPGEGVFYGPKIDIKVKDVLHRSWQCSTIQVDFNMPRRFDLRYTNESGDIERPIMIHRALLGSLERFFGILIEHYGGYFPVWLAPVQAVVIPINDRNAAYARQVQNNLNEKGIRARLDSRSEGMGRKIRDAEMEKTPYILILGDEEEKNQDISLRIHRSGDQGKMALEELVQSILKAIEEKTFAKKVQH